MVLLKRKKNKKEVKEGWKRVRRKGGWSFKREINKKRRKENKGGGQVKKERKKERTKGKEETYSFNTSDCHDLDD